MLTKSTLSSAAVGLAGLAVSACSLILDWDAEGLPCDREKNCAREYSCLVDRCVAKESLVLNETCSQSDQCAGSPDVICGSDPFTCRRRCGDMYGAPGNCQADEYCRPEQSRELENRWIGTCFASECRRDEDCRSDRVCVSISPTAGACLLQCDYDFSTGSYEDNCGGVDTEQYCQPIGESRNQTLVCLEALGDIRASLGGPCAPVENPCEDEMVCAEGVCRFYCGAGFACPSGFCQDFANEDGLILFSACVQ